MVEIEIKKEFPYANNLRNAVYEIVHESGNVKRTDIEGVRTFLENYVKSVEFLLEDDSEGPDETPELLRLGEHVEDDLDRYLSYREERSIIWAQEELPVEIRKKKALDLMSLAFDLTREFPEAKDLGIKLRD